MIRQKDFKILRDILAKRWEKVAKPDSWVALSGGVDSTTVLFTALHAGVKPRTFTFALQGYKSADLLVAKSMAKEFGLEHVVVTVPNDPATVRADARRAIADCHNARIERARKILVQVLHPWYYVKEQLPPNPHVILGIEADSLFLSERKAALFLQEHGEEYTSKYRRPHVDDPQASAYHIHYLCRKLGIKTDDLFNSSELAAWFQRFHTPEIHKPVPKWAFVGAHVDLWKRGNWRRDPSSYQVNSGIRDMHAKAFGCDDKSTIGHYNAIAQELGIVYNTDPPKYTDEPQPRFLNPDGTPAADPTPRDRQVALGLEAPFGEIPSPGLCSHPGIP